MKKMKNKKDKIKAHDINNKDDRYAEKKKNINKNKKLLIFSLNK